MAKFGNTLLAALTLALATAFVACGGDDDGDAGDASATRVVRERDGVRMTLSVDKEKYGPAEPVRVSLTIENTGDAPVEYSGTTPNAPGLTLLVASDLANPQPVVEPGPEDLSGTLGGGAKIERQAEWDKLIDMSLTPVTAPPGKYSIGAGFLMQRAGFADLVELGAAVSFEVEGTAYIQPPLEAVRAMIAADEVKAWAQGRGDVIICAYPPHGYFYNGSFSTGQGAETFDFLYDQQLANGDPICGIGTDGNAWRLVLLGAKGEEPHRLTVHVALGEPVVLDVQEGGPSPVPTATP